MIAVEHYTNAWEGRADMDQQLMDQQMSWRREQKLLKNIFVTTTAHTHQPFCIRDEQLKFCVTVDTEANIVNNAGRIWTACNQWRIANMFWHNNKAQANDNNGMRLFALSRAGLTFMWGPVAFCSVGSILFLISSLQLSTPQTSVGLEIEGWYGSQSEVVGQMTKRQTQTAPCWHWCAMYKIVGRTK